MGVVDHGSLFDAVADAQIVHDPKTGEIRAINETCCELTGYDRSELIGEDLSHIGAGDGTYLDRFEKEPLRRAGRSITFAWRIRTATDDVLSVEVRLTLTTHDGAEVAVASLREAATSTARWEELTRVRDRYRSLFENSQLLLWEFDLSEAKRRAEVLADQNDDLVGFLADNPDELQWVLDGATVLDVNEAAVEFYGAESKQELAGSLNRLLTEEAIDSWRRLLGQLVEGETCFRSTCRNRTLDGEDKDVAWELVVPEAHTDDYARVLMPSMDITERRQRERELERKNEFLDEFVDVVSHDIATPLNVIENKARLVEMTGDTGHAADIFEATERVQALVEELRTLAREGRRVGETSDVELETVVRAAWRSVEARSATLTVESSRTVTASRDRLGQLLENLFRNAVEHGSTGSQPPADDIQIRVGALPEGFYVADDGRGIPETDRNQVFTQGFTTAEANSGLGLAIVRRIARGHGWTVDVAESDGGGARFEVRTDD